MAKKPTTTKKKKKPAPKKPKGIAIVISMCAPKRGRKSNGRTKKSKA